MSFLLDEFVGSHTSNQKSESDHIHRELLDKWEIIWVFFPVIVNEFGKSDDIP